MEVNSGQDKANIIEHGTSPFEIVAMIAVLNIIMVTECNTAATIKFADWWYDSGATVHVCNNKDFFKQYEVATGDERLLIGNHDTDKVLGKGTVEL